MALIEALARHEVDYVLIGGMAAVVYGASRPTEDLDILARDMDDNMERLAAALNDLEASCDVAEHASTFELRAMNTRWNTSAGTVDVLVSAKGPAGTTINWRKIAPTSRTIDHAGQLVRIAALDDLLVMKLSVGRPRNIEVAEELVPGANEAFHSHLANRSASTTPAIQAPPAAPDQRFPER